MTYIIEDITKSKLHNKRSETMNNWDEDKLKQMTEKQNEFTKTKINYSLLAQKYLEIMEKTHNNGDVLPLAFKDVEIAYKGKITEDIKLPEITSNIQEQINEKEQKRQVMHIKHFSRSISHEAWFKFIDEEVNDFIREFPEFKDSLQG